MFTALDIGNSFIKVQQFSDNQLKNYYKFSHQEIENISEVEIVGSVGISSVVPKITEQVLNLLHNNGVLPFLVSSVIKLNFFNNYKTPLTLGADRICNIAGALEVGSTQTHKLIIDFGTATNLNYITNNNEFIGGSIAPGLSTMKYSLLSKTSQLIDVEFDSKILSLGKSTKECIQSGIIYTQKGLIESFINDLNLSNEHLEIFITGGYSDVMKDFMKFNYVQEKKLSLIGIKKLYEINN